MSSAIQPPALKTSVKTSYFRSGNWTLPQNYIYQQRVTHSHSAGARALSLNHYFNCSECVSAPQIVALIEQTCQALCVCRKNYLRQTISGPLCKIRAGAVTASALAPRAKRGYQRDTCAHLHKHRDDSPALILHGGWMPVDGGARLGSGIQRKQKFTIITPMWTNLWLPLNREGHTAHHLFPVRGLSKEMSSLNHMKSRLVLSSNAGAKSGIKAIVCWKFLQFDNFSSVKNFSVKVEQRRNPHHPVSNVLHFQCIWRWCSYLIHK